MGIRYPKTTMMTSLQHPLSPTFEGYVSSEMDALILFEASLSSQLNHSPRQIHDCERNYLIRSGNVFIYEMHASDIRRWKDGIFWTPDLVPDEEGFLVYYELESPSLLEKMRVPPRRVKGSRRVTPRPPTGVPITICLSLLP